MGGSWVKPYLRDCNAHLQKKNKSLPEQKMLEKMMKKEKKKLWRNIFKTLFIFSKQLKFLFLFSISLSLRIPTVFVFDDINKH